jgi:predicted nucleic acid-binding protein
VTIYLDTSVLLRWLLQQPEAIETWGAWDESVTSEITRVEARRSLDRLRVRGSMSDLAVAEHVAFLREVLSRFEEIPVSRRVLERASSSFPTELGTVDAIHLATALAWIEDRGEPLTFLTHDRQLAIGAQACGLDVGPASPRPRRR